MMRWYHAAVLAALLTPAAAAAAPAELYTYVRELQSLQDSMIRGDARAQTLRMKLLADIGRIAAGLKPGAEPGPRNVRAAIVYILSGGMPEAARAYTAASSADPVLKRLLEGATAYASGDKQEAAVLLLETPLQDLPPALAGQIFLIRSSLRKAGEHAAVRQDLRMARLLMPGTLVEESALRRSAAVEAEAKDLDAFEQVSSLYFRRFPDSVYAGQFAASFVQFVAALGYEAHPGRFERLAALIGGLPHDKAAFVFLGIAQKALLAGHGELAGFAAGRALALAEKASPDEARALLYAGAALLPGKPEDYDRGLALLRTADPQFLIPSDAGLLTSALALAAGIRGAAGERQGPLLPSAGTEVSPLVLKARRALEDTAAAMTEGS